jgi:transcriptional regulator with XRE-family HTH domain
MKVDGANLAAARERVFMSQEELAEALGMNPYVVIGLETSERTEFRDNLGKDLAEILFVSRAVLNVTVPSWSASVHPFTRSPMRANKRFASCSVGTTTLSELSLAPSRAFAAPLPSRCSVTTVARP